MNSVLVLGLFICLLSSIFLTNLPTNSLLILQVHSQGAFIHDSFSECPLGSILSFFLHTDRVMSLVVAKRVYVSLSTMCILFVGRGDSLCSHGECINQQLMKRKG